MPKLIDYPRTSYSGAWEVADIVDDTGGKCALETCARKLNRKVSGSFKAIVGSAVKFGLLTSKREILTTTTLFRRIKHAYDKQEELLFHREAFLTPPLFTQLCRKFRSRELPVAMLDVLLTREFDVEEINAQGVSKAFVEGARMVNLLDEHNVVADIDQLTAQQPPRRELASPPPDPNVFRRVPSPPEPAATPPPKPANTEPKPVGAASLPRPAAPLPPPSAATTTPPTAPAAADAPTATNSSATALPLPIPRNAPPATADAIANLFGLGNASSSTRSAPNPEPGQLSQRTGPTAPILPTAQRAAAPAETLFQIQLTGPGINTQLDVTDVADLALVRALLDKIERQLNR